jgi:hypothetical protein
MLHKNLSISSTSFDFVRPGLTVLLRLRKRGVHLPNSHYLGSKPIMDVVRCEAAE